MNHVADAAGAGHVADAAGAAHATTSALVAVLGADSGRAARALAALEARADFTVGPAQGRRLPLVLECADPAASRAACAWLADLEGVEHVELVFVDFGHAPLPGAAP